MVDDAKLHQFIGQMLSDLGGTASITLVRIGDSLGLYKALHAHGPMTVAELAAAAGVNERYLREWLSQQAASNYLSYDPATQKFALAPEQAMVFAVEDSPVYMVGAFTCMSAFLDNLAKVQPAFKTGGGVAWGYQASCLFCAVAQFFRPGYLNNLVSNWLPALDGVVEKLERGGRVAASARQRARCHVEYPLRGRDGQGLSGKGFRSRHLFRLPARHGRPGRRGSACAPARG
jgi:hypothetical protein